MYKKSSFYKGTGKNNRPMIISIIMTVVLLIIVLVVMMFLPRGGTNQNSLQGTGLNYTVGQSINQIGEIFSTGNRNFFYELVFDGKEIGLKSDTLNLGAYSGSVQISGSVVDILDNIPVIKVESISAVDGETQAMSGTELSGDVATGENQMPIQAKYYFGQYGLSFDFTDFSGYAAKIENGSIVIQQYSTGAEAKKIFSISPYECKIGDSTKDCDKQLSNASNFKMITNSNGMKFYNLSESENWIFFNGTLWGYKVNVSDENAFTKLTKAMSMISEDKIKSDLKSIAKQTCKKTGVAMDAANDISIKSEKSVLYAYITGVDANLNEVDCKLKLSLGDTVTAKLVSVSSAGATTPTQDSVSSTSKVDEIYTGSASTSSFTEPANMLKMESKMGYTIYFPKSLSFKQVGVDDLGLSGISCISKVAAIYYKDKDNLDSSPTIEIYVCKTKLGDQEIANLMQSSDYTYKKSQTTDLKFFVKASDDAKKYVSQIVFK